jgi:hypothetical protein
VEEAIKDPEQVVKIETDPKAVQRALWELETERIITKQLNEVVGEAKSGSKKLHNIQVYPELRQIFPTFDTDNLTTVVERFIKLFPALADKSIKDFESQLDENETGFSDEKLMKHMCDIPAPIYYAMKSIDNNYWGKDQYKHYREFKLLCPKLHTKDKNPK